MKQFLFLIVFFCAQNSFADANSTFDSLLENERVLKISQAYTELPYHTAESLDNLLPMLRSEIQRGGTEFLRVFDDLYSKLRGSEFRETLATLDQLLRTYPPFHARQLSNQYFIEFRFEGDWNTGLTIGQFHEAIDRLRLQRKVYSVAEIPDAHFSYLDRIVIRKGSVFSVASVQRRLPNPEAYMGLNFEAYFYDTVVTVPDAGSIDELAKHLAGVSNWPPLIHDDAKRLPVFFADRIAAARLGQNSFEYFCRRLLGQRPL